jgi:spore maturation protein CgeB
MQLIAEKFYTERCNEECYTLKFHSDDEPFQEMQPDAENNECLHVRIDRECIPWE